MARVGSFTVGDGTKVGTTGLTSPEQAAWDVLAGQSPALPSRAVPVRTRCAEICTFDPNTWTVGAPLLYQAAGATRQASLTGIGFQQETLTFEISNAAYYYANPTALALIAPGAWLAVQWTVGTATATTQQLGGVFRVATSPSRNRLVGVSSFSVTAQDWAQPALALQSGGGWVRYGFDPPPTWTSYRLAYVAAGKPLFPTYAMDGSGADLSWGTQAAALLVYALGFGTSVDVPHRAATGGPVLVGSGDFGTAFLQVGDPGKPTSAYDWFTWLWPYVGGFYLAYRSETGHLVFLAGANNGYDSGTYLTTDTTPLGATPLPWTTPLARSLNKPEATKVQYWFKGRVSNTPAGVSGGILSDDTAFRGEAISNAAANPHDGTRNSTLIIVEQDTVQQAAGFVTFSAFCEWRLRQALGAADTLTIPVDAAYPPPPLSTLVRVKAGSDVDGWYRLTSFTQPLSGGLASWQCQWWSDA